jgi:hypothetical protein
MLPSLTFPLYFIPIVEVNFGIARDNSRTIEDGFPNGEDSRREEVCNLLKTEVENIIKYTRNTLSLYKRLSFCL